MSDPKRDAKRERENFAIKLRKERREELQKRHRGFGQTNAALAADLSSGLFNNLDFTNLTIDEALSV